MVQPPSSDLGADGSNLQIDTYQDVQGVLWFVFVLLDGSKDGEDETGEDQEEAGRDERKFLVSLGHS